MRRRKNIGVVFTPNNIADYMSKILIYNYLKTSFEDKIIIELICNNKLPKNETIKNDIYNLLKSIKILEPSVGEGALLIKISKLLFKILNLLNKKDKNIKKDIINSLHAYEIDNNSLEKAKKNILATLNMENAEFKFFNNDDFLLLNIEEKITDKFDIIIANPPYIREKENKSLFIPLKTSHYYQGRSDIWYLFFLYSADLLKDKGIMSFIIPNNWTTNESASKLRAYVQEKMKILSIVDFNDSNIFKMAMIQTMILTIKKEYVEDGEYYCDYKKKETLTPLDDFLDFKHFEKIIVNNSLSNLTFTKLKITNLLNKIEAKSNFKLKKLKEITQGIIHPQNVVSAAHVSKNKSFILDDGIFVITRFEKKELNLTRREKNIVKPTYTTRELKRYFKFGFPRFWTIYTDRTFNKISKMKKYPNIKKHLDKYQEIMTSDYKPYSLHRTRNKEFFKKGPKILVARKSQIPHFTYMEDESYPTFTFNVIISERIDLKYLTMLLNSKLMIFWLKNRGKMQGVHFQIDIAPLLSIPIVNNQEKTKELSNKLDLLIKEKKLNKKIINEADSIIYEIYGLTSEEIDIVEKDIKESHEKYIIS